jgi:shikimate dehydrogenase
MPAFRDTLKPLLKDTYKSALVLGTGGAAKAVIRALHDLHIDFRVVSRAQGPGVITYEEISQEFIRNFQIIINATPAGMYPDISNCPHLPYSGLTSYHLLYDLVYNPEETLFLKKGRENGARIKNGYEMLRLQAELSWCIWNELSPMP